MAWTTTIRAGEGITVGTVVIRVQDVYSDGALILADVPIHVGPSVFAGPFVIRPRYICQIGQEISLRLVRIKGSRARLSIDAPQQMRIAFLNREGSHVR